VIYFNGCKQIGLEELRRDRLVTSTRRCRYCSRKELETPEFQRVLRKQWPEVRLLTISLQPRSRTSVEFIDVFDVDGLVPIEVHHKSWTRSREPVALFLWSINFAAETLAC
jgi:hypothetical protein